MAAVTAAGRGAPPAVPAPGETGGASLVDSRPQRTAEPREAATPFRKSVRRADDDPGAGLPAGCRWDALDEAMAR
jgi:hypothetical protein